MKLGVKTGDYATGGGTAHGKYKVANNSTMQQILSNFLYSDKIKSVIRELSTNAFESHLVAGQTKPFKVNLPTSLSPQFSIRDFGTGLSKEQLEEMYCVYGASTKRDSNEMTGCFGIGSKSPFAYTDIFTVISYYNGTKYVVSNTKNTYGQFCYDVLAEVETDEENGLEIIFEVNNNDIPIFKEKAEQVYKYFNLKPDCNISLKFETNTKKELEHGEWTILGYKSYYYSARSVVIMGQVAYDIDPQHFKGNDKCLLDNCSVEIRVNIGEVSVAPSRENLQYDKHTLDKLSQVLNDCHTYVKKIVEEKIKNCTSKWEAFLIAKKFFAENSYYSKILGNQLTFNGQPVVYESSFYPRKRNKAGFSEAITVYKYVEDGPNGVYESRKNTSIYVDENAEFAIYEKGGYAAARRYVEKNPNVILYVFQPEDENYILDTLGVDKSKIHMTSSFPAVVRQARAKSVGNKVQAYRYHIPTFNPYYGSSDRLYWNADEIDLDNEKGYYCPINSFKINGNVDPSLIKDQLNGLKVIGVLTSRITKVENNSNWIHVKELIKAELDKMVKDPNVLKYYDAEGYSNNDASALLRVRHKLCQNSTLVKTLNDIAEYQKYKDKVREFRTLVNRYKAISNEDYKFTSSKLVLKFDLDRYPLLQYIPSYNYEKAEVLAYINSIDTQP